MTARQEPVHRSGAMDRVGMQRWLAQPEIEILQHGNLLVGFHQAQTSDIDSLLTFYYPDRSQVDEQYERFKSVALTEPKVTRQYGIYNFFAQDPDGRRIEFQTFLDPVPGLPAVAGSA